MNVLVCHSQPLALAGLAVFTGASVRGHLASEDRVPASAQRAVQRTMSITTWGSSNPFRTDLSAQIAEKNVNRVRKKAEQVTTSLRMLPNIPAAFPTDKLRHAQGAVANLAKALDAVHAAADGGNQGEAETQRMTGDALLKFLAAQYPAEVASAKPIALEQGGPSAHLHGDAATA